jgi:hypothetical protein
LKLSDAVENLKEKSASALGSKSARWHQSYADLILSAGSESFVMAIPVRPYPTVDEHNGAAPERHQQQ